MGSPHNFLAYHLEYNHNVPPTSLYFLYFKNIYISKIETYKLAWSYLIIIIIDLDFERDYVIRLPLSHCNKTTFRMGSNFFFF